MFPKGGNTVGCPVQWARDEEEETRGAKAASEWTMLVVIKGRVVGKAIVKKKKTPQPGQKVISLRPGNPKARVKTGAYRVIRVNEEVFVFYAEPAGKLAPIFYRRKD